MATSATLRMESFEDMQLPLSCKKPDSLSRPRRSRSTCKLYSVNYNCQGSGRKNKRGGLFCVQKKNPRRRASGVSRIRVRYWGWPTGGVVAVVVFARNDGPL